MRRHGQSSKNDILDAMDVYDGDDPDLAMVVADMHTWSLMHPCTCDDDDPVCLCNE